MYGQTWDDLGSTPPSRAWQMLRSLRHNPPGAAQGGERRETFDAALEQAEQLFRAAEVVTPASSPLLIFYGLSQAGRAIAAAASGPENVSRWRLRGHGITNGSSDGIAPATLSRLKIKDHGSGSFTELANILGAASLPASVSLGDVWCLLPESSRFPLPGMGNARPIDLSPASHLRADSHHLVASVPVPSAILSRESFVPDPSGLSIDWHARRVAATEYLSQFPSLAGWRFTTADGQPIAITSYGERSTQVQIVWDKPSDVSDQDAILAYACGYRGSYLAFPAAGTDPRPPHPLLLWWAVLYPLSKLARYEPSLWAKLISIDSSAAAAAVEHLLRESLLILPELIHRTIRSVS